MPFCRRLRGFTFSFSTRLIIRPLFFAIGPQVFSNSLSQVFIPTLIGTDAALRRF